tara:strand:- start:115 stop:501 length:387 start_codon:yes stop_codon:yes gene_type:complete
MELDSNVDHVNSALARALGSTVLTKVAREGSGVGQVVTSGLVGAGAGGAIGAGIGMGRSGWKSLSTQTGKTVKELKTMSPATLKVLLKRLKSGGAALKSSIGKGALKGGKIGAIAGGLGLAGLAAATR